MQAMVLQSLLPPSLPLETDGVFRRLDEPRPELDIDLNPGAIRVKGS